jgi:signal transduction histidine kinase
MRTPGRAVYHRRMITVRGRSVPWGALDVLIALVLAALMVRALIHPASGAPVLIELLLTTAMCAAVAVRRAAPVPAFVVAGVASAISGYLGFSKDPMVALAFVLYTVVVQSSVRVAVVSLLAAETIVVAAGSARVPAGIRHDAVIATAAVQLAAACMGWALRAHRTATTALREQAERRVQAEIDRAERALAEERLRIARELHDIVAHTMSVIAVQATVGAHVMGRRPDAGRAALRTIEDTARNGLGELRLMLGVLRGMGRTGDLAVPPPAPDLAALPDLLTRIRDAGLAIDLSVTGVPRRLPAGVELSAYRIVQEALTNVVRHSRAGRAEVQMSFLDGALLILVIDEGPGAAELPSDGSALSGHGLIGMRERIAALGGTLQAGPTPTGGYRVRAVLPATRANSDHGPDSQIVRLPPDQQGPVPAQTRQASADPPNDDAEPTAADPVPTMAGAIDITTDSPHADEWRATA